MQPLAVEPAGATPHDLDGHRANARMPTNSSSATTRSWRKYEEGQIVLHVANRGGDNVEVVQQPLGGGDDVDSERVRVSGFWQTSVHRPICARGLDEDPNGPFGRD